MTIDINALLISKTTSILEAMRIIGEGAAQVALVVDENKKLLGTITDGDIRRGLLRGETLNSEAANVMNSEFKFADSKLSTDVIIKTMQSYSLRQMPMLDDEKKVVDILLLDKLLTPEKLANPIVIMAGGKGTRLRPITNTCPKPMLKVNGKPILQILIEECVSYGLQNFYISVNYLKEQIIDYFGDGSEWGVNIKYIIEGNPLGTAGSLSLLPKDIKKPILVMNGDVLTRLNPTKLIRFHEDNNSVATLSVREHKTIIPFGVVNTNEIELESFTEKPQYTHLVNAGVYIINPEVLELIPKNVAMDMPTLLQEVKNKGKSVNVFPIHEYWVDVGRPETMEEAQVKWEEQI